MSLRYRVASSPPRCSDSFESLLHGRVRQIALHHARRLQNLHGMVRLAQTDSAGALLNLQSKVEGEQSKIRHLELHLHFFLNFLISPRVIPVMMRSSTYTSTMSQPPLSPQQQMVCSCSLWWNPNLRRVPSRCSYHTCEA
jgi:hypothetical protein